MGDIFVGKAGDGMKQTIAGNKTEQSHTDFAKPGEMPDKFHIPIGNPGGKLLRI